MDLLVILASGVATGTVLLYAAVGEIFAERSGVLNLGVEGMMLIGAMTAYRVSATTLNPWLGLLVAMIAAGLIPVFLLLRAIELPHTGLTTAQTAYSMAIGGTLIGIMWSITMIWLQTRLYAIWYNSVALKLYAIGLCLSFLLLPLFHYIFLTPKEFHYISVSANFFALNRSVQLMTLCIGAVVVIGLERLQRSWQKDRTEGENE